MFIEKNIQPDLAIHIAASGPIRNEYETWRVIAYKNDGTWYFVPNNHGYDYKLRRNAEKEAKRCVTCNWAAYAVVKKIKIVETEIPDGTV